MSPSIPFRWRLRAQPRTAVWPRSPAFLIPVALLSWTSACEQGKFGSGQNADGATGPPLCVGGTDQDGDGYGPGCAAGPDCDDFDPRTSPSALEICDGVDNNCNGKVDESKTSDHCSVCDSGCDAYGDPFVVDPAQDPNVLDVDGVNLNPDGDLQLDQTKTNHHLMWIANTDDQTVGTISKIDTQLMKEVARYYTVSCATSQASTCSDVNGKPIDQSAAQKPSRTAVDLNFDVWVANRAFGGQASATKIASAETDCIDRDNDGVINTSADRDGDGKINVDCNGDGLPDDRSTVCTGALKGKAPEFLGYDDECVLFTVNYGEKKAVGRSICLASGIDPGASDAWVGTFNQNKFYRIHGTSGKVDGPFPIAAGHHSYGCVVDSAGVLWSVDLGNPTAATKPWVASLTYLNTANASATGPLLKPPLGERMYAITLDQSANVWIAGVGNTVYRYRPKRTSFDALPAGTWTVVQLPTQTSSAIGIAADKRGKIWVGIAAGYVLRLEQGLADGVHDLSGMADYWSVAGKTIKGVGVDFSGHVWAISRDSDLASRLDIDGQGNPINPPTGQKNIVPVGKQPYTYSDFTGFGLKFFTRPQGRYVYALEPCQGTGLLAQWKKISWQATTPAGTSVSLRLRSGDHATSLGAWSTPYSASPALLDATGPQPLHPNPARLLQLEFTFKTTAAEQTPVLHNFVASYDCSATPE
jgi:streptogramin lyase